MVVSLVAVVLAALPQWSAPPACPDRDAFVRRVEQLAGRVPEDDELTTTVVVDGPPWRGTVALVRRDVVVEQRVIDAPTCAAVLDASAVVLAVAMDPVVVIRRHPTVTRDLEVPEHRSAAPAPVHADVPRVVVASDPPPIEPRAPGSSPPRRRVLHGVGVRVGAGVGVGGWNRAAGGVELALAWSRNRMAVELVGRYWIPRRDALEDRGAVRVELGTAAARVCWLGGRRRVTLAGCAGLEAGDLVVDGVTAPARERVHFPWVAPVVAGRVGLQVRGPFAVWLGIEAAVPVIRLQGTLRAVEPVKVYDAGAPAVRALTGIELRWSLTPRSP